MSLNNSWFSIQVQHGINVSIDISHFSRQTGLYNSETKISTSDFIDSEREFGMNETVKCQDQASANAVKIKSLQKIS